MPDFSATGRGSRRALPPGCVFWVVFAGEHEQTRPLTVFSRGGVEALAVFSHKEEAEVFLWLSGAVADVWRPRSASGGEVASLLYGPSCGTQVVALDPLPGMLDHDLSGVVTLGWASFTERLAGRDPALPDAG